MARISLFLAAAFCLAGASVLAQGGAGLGGGGGTAYSGYAYADCSPSKAPAVRLVLLTGPVPATIPAKPPRPAIELIIYSPVDKAAGQTFTVAREGETPGLALSCPVVGDCAAARTGTVTLDKRGADGALSGTFNATWGTTPARSGKFTNVAWRDAAVACK